MMVVEEDGCVHLFYRFLIMAFAASVRGTFAFGAGINETNQSNAPDQQGQVVIDGSNLVTPALQENLQEDPSLRFACSWRSE